MTETWPLGWSVVALVAVAGVIVLAGTRLTVTTDELADRLRIGEAIAGALLLGGITSLSGIVTTVTGSVEGDAGFALANPVGGVAIQSVWLAVADLLYRRANLEHAAASLENILQALVVVALLSLPVLAYATPTLAIGWIHPLTLVIPVLYGYGYVLLRRMRHRPMWRPVQTRETREDEPQPSSGTRLSRLWMRVAVYGTLVAFGGWVIAQAGLGVIAATGVSSGVLGFTVTTIITSFPELVSLVTAVRVGALTLGVSTIIGGNAFDALQISLADATYTGGTIYQAAGPSSLVLLGGTVLVTAVLAAGLIMRDRKGVGFEGLAVPLVYVGTVVLAVIAS